MMSETHGKFTVGVPRITCTREAWDKLIGYSQCSVPVKGTKDTRRMVEISGMGLAVQEAPNTFHIQDFFLVPSKGAGASTEIDNDGMAALVLDLMNSDTPEDVGNLRIWWHTHPGMSLFWSGQDTSQMLSFGEESMFPWLISIVTDGKGDYRCRLDCFEGMGIRTWFDGLAIEILGNPSIQAELQAEVDEKVTIAPIIIQPFHGMGYHGGWNHGRGYKVTDRRRINSKETRKHVTTPTPEEWAELTDIEDPSEYQEVFNELQAREEEAYQDQLSLHIG